MSVPQIEHIRNGSNTWWNKNTWCPHYCLQLQIMLPSILDWFGLFPYLCSFLRSQMMNIYRTPFLLDCFTMKITFLLSIGSGVSFYATKISCPKRVAWSTWNFLGSINNKACPTCILYQFTSSSYYVSLYNLKFLCVSGHAV